MLMRRRINRKEVIYVEFKYVLGWYSLKTRQVKALGGFKSLAMAKDYSDMVDALFWNGFCFVDSPEGVYVKGYEDYRGSNMKWFSPEEVKNDKVKLITYKGYDEEIVRIDEYLPYDDYIKFTKGNVFNETVTHSAGSKESVLDKLSNNRKSLEASIGTMAKDVIAEIDKHIKLPEASER